MNFKIEPVFGYFFSNGNLIALQTSYSQGYIKAISSDTIYYRKDRSYTFGTFYRYYLPERKTYTSFFVQGGLNLLYFKAEKSEVTGFSKITFYDLIIPFEVGIRIPINKFNFELSLIKNYRLFKALEYDEYYAGKFLGNIRISYIFK